MENNKFTSFIQTYKKATLIILMVIILAGVLFFYLKTKWNFSKDRPLTPAEWEQITKDNLEQTNKLGLPSRQEEVNIMQYNAKNSQINNQ